MEVLDKKGKEKHVRVKFNFTLANPKYDFSLAVKKAKEEKSHLAYLAQSHIDFSMADSAYKAGEVHEVTEEFYQKFSERIVETYNPLFGSFQGKAFELAKRLKVPYMLKVDENNNVLDPMQQKLDLYPTNA